MAVAGFDTAPSEVESPTETIKPPAYIRTLPLSYTAEIEREK
jgi:hypothetical protein